MLLWHALTAGGLFLIIWFPGRYRCHNATIQGNRESIENLEVKAAKFIDSVFEKVLPIALKNSRTQLSPDCNLALLRLVVGLRRLDGWALKVIDASGKLPGGVMKGTLTAFGSYDECVDIKEYAKGSKEFVHFQGKYCSVQIHPQEGLFESGPVNVTNEPEQSGSVVSRLRKYGDFMSAAYLRFGVCVPASCNDDDVQQLAKSIIGQSELPLRTKVRRCETKSTFALSTEQIAILAVIGLLFCFVAVGTAVDCFCGKSNGTILRVIKDFSFPKNIESTFVVRRTYSEIPCLDGIRFLTSIWIILGHSYLLPLGVHYTRFRRVSGFVDFQHSMSFAAIGNFYLSVDTFFFISGLLLVYTKKTAMTAGAPLYFFKHILQRLFRISPIYFMTIGLFLLMPLLGSGPMWYDAVESQADICKTHWWANLLYIQNFWPIKENCMLHSWYLAATMQIHIVAYFIIWPMLKSLRLGILMNSLAFVFSVLATGLVTFWYELKPTMDVLGGHKALAGVTSLIYIRPYSHLPAFSIGIFYGLILIYRDRITFSKFAVVLGSVASLAVSSTVVFGLSDYYKGQSFSEVETVMYAALHRPCWSICVGWLVLLCATNNGGIINTILSWKAFAPLAKLSFSAYLIHPLIILYQLGISRERIYLGHSEMIMSAIAVSCVSYALSLFMHTGLELPFMKLEKLIFSGSSEKKAANRDVGVVISVIDKPTM